LGVLDESAEYVCPSCGESILIALDPTAGHEQRYVEDCPVCCRPNVICVWYDAVGGASVSVEPE